MRHIRSDYGGWQRIPRGPLGPVPGGSRSPILGLLLAILTAAGLLTGCGGKETAAPAQLTPLDKALQPLRRDFEAARGKVRLVAIVAPTCGHCGLGVRALSTQLLPEFQEGEIEVFVVWNGIVPADVELGARRFSERYLHPAIRYYWDETGRASRAFAQHVGLGEGRHITNLYYLYGPGDTWDPHGTMASEPPGQNALLAGWMPGNPRARYGQSNEVRLPALEIPRVRDAARQLLAEGERGGKESGAP